MKKEIMIEGIDVVKAFTQPPVQVLKSLSFQIEKGEFVAVTGHSGSGKSTLLYVVSGLDSLTSGKVLLAGQDLETMEDQDVHQFRNESIGFVFQFHYLLPELTCFENILMPARKIHQEKFRRQRALDLLELFELEACTHKKPSQISGGQQQRVAIARSLIMEPAILFADEPTGNLDSINGEKVISLFQKINREYDTTILMVTHEAEFAKRASRHLHLVDGRIITDQKNTLQHREYAGGIHVEAN